MNINKEDKAKKNETVLLCRSTNKQEKGKWFERLSIIEQMKEWEVGELNLWNNHRATIINDIAHLQLPLLQAIHLSFNQIESIESLSRVSMPALQLLSISFNFIRNISTLRKASLFSLKNIDLSKITQMKITTLSLMDKCRSQKLAEGIFRRLETLSIEFNHQSSDCHIQDTRSLLKLQTVYISAINLHHSRIQNQNQVSKMYDKKWIQAQIFLW